MRQVIFKESRYLSRGHVHYYLWDTTKPDLESLHLDDIMPRLLALGAEGFVVERVQHPDPYTTLIYFGGGDGNNG